MRLLFIALLTSIPFHSYVFAKGEANYIYNNWVYKVWVNKPIEYQKDTIKFLGKAGNVYFFITKDNKKTIIKNIDDLKTLELVEMKVK